MARTFAHANRLFLPTYLLTPLAWYLIRAETLEAALAVRLRALWVHHDGVGPLVDDDLAGHDLLRGHDEPPLGAVAVGHLSLGRKLGELGAKFKRTKF